MSDFNNNSNISIYLQKLVMQILEKNGLLKGNKLFGVIEDIISETVVKVYIEKELKSQLCNCPPKNGFQIGDRVLVENINNNPHDRFIVALVSGISTDTEVIDYDNLPTEPVEIVRNEKGKAYRFVFGYDNPKTLWTQEITFREDGKAYSITNTYPDGAVFIRYFIRDDKDRVWKYE